ncbi:MAG: zinc-ribbon domain containing protein [Pyrinomonadaceae bacterium]|nr:zinc-ribbon domain containing protein [Pyrinomonadaceae bacterium]
MYLNTVSYFNDFVTVKPKTTESEFPDRFIKCIDCDESFVWTSGEQTFFRDKGLQNPPKRCRDCKQAKNDRITAINEAQTAGIKQKIEVAIDCAGCGASTTVPFYPSQGRPVYCRSCFLSKQNHLL